MSTPTDEEKRKLYAGERLYSAAEVALERAALLREAAEAANPTGGFTSDTPFGYEAGRSDAATAILAIPTDQSALARVEAAAYERALKDAAERRCEWCARKWDFDIFNQHPQGCFCHWCRCPDDLKLVTRPKPDMHVNEDRSVFRSCEAFDILALQDRGREAESGSPASDVQGKPEERR